MFRQSIIRISMEYFQLSKYLFFYEDINLNRHFWVSCSGPPKFQNNCPPSKSAQNLKSQMAKIKRHIESVHEIYIYILYIYLNVFSRKAFRRSKNSSWEQLASVIRPLCNSLSSRAKLRHFSKRFQQLKLPFPLAQSALKDVPEINLKRFGTLLSNM